MHRSLDVRQGCSTEHRSIRTDQTDITKGMLMLLLCNGVGLEQLKVDGVPFDKVHEHLSSIVSSVSRKYHDLKDENSFLRV